MIPEAFDCDVSRETFEKLQTYEALLKKWQAAINLVSPHSLSEAWLRHFADSAQLGKFVSRETRSLTDLGSGAGFPGLVLAIMRPDIHVTLIESDTRKCEFLRTVSRETKTPVTILSERIENTPLETIPDTVTARALADLTQLLTYITPWAKTNHMLEIVLLKGEKAGEEIRAAQQEFEFKVKKFQSQTDPKGVILKISGLRRKA